MQNAICKIYFFSFFNEPKHCSYVCEWQTHSQVILKVYLSSATLYLENYRYFFHCQLSQSAGYSHCLLQPISFCHCLCFCKQSSHPCQTVKLLLSWLLSAVIAIAAFPHLTSTPPPAVFFSRSTPGAKCQFQNTMQMLFPTYKLLFIKKIIKKMRVQWEFIHLTCASE